MAPERAPFKRCLLLLRRLAHGPADWNTLTDFVEGHYDGEAYAGGLTPAGKKRFDNDIKQLREWGVDIAFDGDYHLQSYGDFDPVALGEQDLNTLAFLAETFAPGSVNANAVQQLLRRVADWLPESERLSLAARRQRWRIDLERKDDDVIDAEVQARIERAIAQHRLLRFAYRSPGQADGTPRTHRAAVASGL
ncbi:MAG: hypothetical protein IPK16_18325 [Anaerolineales bacterium]|nr:hypothetical protein [Anaerolineales bacterium]